MTLAARSGRSPARRITAAADDVLAAADLPWAPRTARALAAGAVVLPGLLALALGLSAPLVAVVVLGPAVGVPVLVHHRAAGRPGRVAAALPDVLRGMSAAVRAGMSLRQALERAAPQAPAPADAELAAAVADLRSGGRLDDALTGVAVRAPHPDIEVAVCAVLVAVRTGADMGRLLRGVADGIDARRAAAADLASLTAQARATAWLVAAIPIVGAAAVEALAPGVLGRTFGGGPGRLAGAVAVAMFAAAFLIVRRLARVEP